MIGYTIVLIITSFLFKDMYIDKEHFLFYSFIIVLIIYLLNNTIKPILFKITIPITGITLGLFYPFLNLFILKLADWLLGSHFDLKNFWITLIIAIFLSVMNILMEGIIIKPLIKRIKKRR
ncbi:MAG: phage holin family protein [Bacilli bacterium]|nr:phage holin family protein [Bacilli bacterium]